MNQNFEVDTGKNIEVKNDALMPLFCFLITASFTIRLFFWDKNLSTFSFNKLYQEWKIPEIIIFLVLLCFMVGSLRWFLDRKVSMRVNSEGMWTNENGFIKWQEVLSFQTSNKYVKPGHRYRIYLSLKSTDKITIDYYMMDKNFQDVRKLIEFYAIKYSFPDLGDEKESN